MPDPHHALRRAVRRTAAVVVAAALLGGACSPSDDEPTADSQPPSGGEAATPLPDDVNLVTTAAGTEPRRGGRLAYGLNAETDGWNPTLSRWGPAGLVVGRALFDLLVTIDAEGRWQPELTEAWEPSEDFRRWTVTVREGVRFSNGRPLDGPTLAEALQYIKDSPLTGVTLAKVSSITALDDRRVEIVNEEPWATMPYAFATQLGAVADPTWLATSSPSDPVGAGPFVLAEWQPGERLLARANPDYWRDGYPLLDEIEFVPEPDGVARNAGLEDGDLDVIQVTDGSELARVRAEADAGALQLACGEGAEPGETFVMLNLQAEPFDDPTARRAITMATDPAAVAERIGAGQFEVATGMFPEGSTWYVDTDHPGYDPEGARQALEDYESANGAPLQVSLTATNSAASTEMNQLLVEQWEAAGIDVTLTTVDQPLLIRNVLFGDYQAVLWQQFDGAHPSMDTIWLHPIAAAPPPEPALNFARNDDPEIERLLVEALEVPDVATNQERWGAVQRRLSEVLPYVWLYHGRICAAAVPAVVDLVRWETPEGQPGLEMFGGSHPLWQVWLDR